MDYSNVSFAGIFLASVASMVIGFAWYGKSLFGPRWMKERGYTPEAFDAMKKKKRMGRIYGISFISSFLIAYAFSIITPLFGGGVREAIELAVLAWAGFVVPIQLNEVLFGDTSRDLFAINAGYQLASFVAMALIVYGFL